MVMASDRRKEDGMMRCEEERGGCYGREKQQRNVSLIMGRGEPHNREREQTQ